MGKGPLPQAGLDSFYGQFEELGEACVGSEDINWLKGGQENSDKAKRILGYKPSK